MLRLQHPEQCQNAIKESPELQTDPGAVHQRQPLRKCMSIGRSVCLSLENDSVSLV